MCGFNLESLSEFTAEYRTKKVVSGYPVYSWHKYHGRANQRLDCFVYALAAALLSRVKFDCAEPQRIPKDQVEAYMKKMQETAKERTADARRTPYGMQPGSDQLAGEALRIKTAVQGFGVFPEREKGRPKFGVQPSREFLGPLKVGHPPNENVAQNVANNYARMNAGFDFASFEFCPQWRRDGTT
jgi:hypothetical protein